MIDIGVYNKLEILRETSVGLYLGDEEGEDVLLPNKYCPETYEIGDKLDVFVYLDYDERKIATNIDPKIKLFQFAQLEVKDVSRIGAFLDWGLEKELMVPFKEQRQRMEVGRWYVVYLDLDESTDRLYASNKIEKFLDNEHLHVEEGDEVDILIYQQTDLGYSVIVNHEHKGLIYSNEIFQKIRIGETLKGHVKKIREENKLDITLQPVGYKQAIDGNTQKVLDYLENNGGHMSLTDKSSPDDIQALLQMSKKNFKKAVGALYKERQITIDKDGIQLINT